MTAAVVAPACDPLPVDGRSSRAIAAVRGLVRRALHVRLRCLLLGHEDTFAREPRRLKLRCAACGRETVGWAIGTGTTPVITSRSASPTRPTGAQDAPSRLGPWTLRRRNGRGEARERERQRLVAAATRAAEPRPEERDASPPPDHRPAGRLLASERPPDRWTNAARRGRAGLGG